MSLAVPWLQPQQSFAARGGRRRKAERPGQDSAAPSCPGFTKKRPLSTPQGTSRQAGATSLFLGLGFSQQGALPGELSLLAAPRTPLRTPLLGDLRSGACPGYNSRNQCSCYSHYNLRA
jgi:hypothetical protein